ncbi:Rha family transcriptional regulator [uncultured Robinsoniella sp.]|uniref:Rha family transcriptional regulator n=1 Tax=uncultured Robinsoniella sp. TaxID=904190 RepID=UPI00374F6E6B
MNIEDMIQGNPQALVVQRNGVDVADSLQVAECFGKRHDNVIRSIEQLIGELSAHMDPLSDEDFMYSVVSREVPQISIKKSGALNFEDAKKESRFNAVYAKNYFIEDIYKDVQGKTRKHYWLTRDGFSLLVMGFTGPAALHWKLLYIEAFNKMEEKIKSQPDITAMVTQITTQVIQTLLPEIKKAVEPPAFPAPEKKPTSLEDLPPILTVYDIRDYLQIGQRQAYELAHNDDFPVMKIGNRLLIQKSDFAEWLQRRKGYV